MRRLVIPVLAVALLGGALVGTGGAASNRTLAPKDCKVPRFKPSRIVLACGDFGTYVAHIDWGGWSRHRAHGNGILYENTCNPSCSAGNFKRYQTHIRLRRVREKTCGGRRVDLFRKAILGFPHNQPPDADRLHHSKLFCAP